MKLKFLIVITLLLAEVVYMGFMVVDTDDPVVLETVLKVPVVGDWMYERRIADVRERAESGDVHSMMALYYRADDLENDEDVEYARQLLQESGSATATLFIFHEDGVEQEKLQTREFMLLEAQAMRENIRPFLLQGDPNRAYIQQSQRYAAALKTIRLKAERGDRNARWVLNTLIAESS